MRKVYCYMIAASLILTPSSVALAKQNTKVEQTTTYATQQKKNQVTTKKTEATTKKTEATTKKTEATTKKTQSTTKKTTAKKQTVQKKTTQKKATETTTKQQQTKKKVRISEKKTSFKISTSPVIKYGKYKLPISPITKGMGATVDFNKETTVLTVTKGTTTILINFKEKTVMVNGVADTNTTIFTAKNSNKMTVLIKYIANKLGARVNIKDDKITTEIPGLDLPTSVTVTPVGGTVVANALNSTNLSMTATATIIAGQAIGGKAELYVGSTLVATDATIEAADTTVTFTIGDETPTNEELQAFISKGGKVLVKLYNAEQKSVTSAVLNPKLTVDYVTPTITSVQSVVLTTTGSAITINVTGAVAVNDKVDVTKISLYDTALNTTYQLTASSIGYVSSESKLTIKLSVTDMIALANLGGSTVSLKVATGAFLSDKAGNESTISQEIQNVPVSIIE